MVFQRFDPDWESYIDLEEDSIVLNKEKLKLVVTPSLNDTINSTVSSLCTDNLSITVSVIDMFHVWHIWLIIYFIEFC